MTRIPDLDATRDRYVHGLMGFRLEPKTKVFAAFAPIRGGGMMSGDEVFELPCPKAICDGPEDAQHRWARAELAKLGIQYKAI